MCNDEGKEQACAQVGKVAVTDLQTLLPSKLSVDSKMDRILVLEDGKIVEEGTHKKLLAKKGQYADLWNHQVGGFIE